MSTRVARIAGSNGFPSREAVAGGWSAIGREPLQQELFDSYIDSRLGQYRLNIANFVGALKVPVGIAGPFWGRGHSRKRGSRGWWQDLLLPGLDEGQYERFGQEVAYRLRRVL